jgi:hypothetical protein
MLKLIQLCRITQNDWYLTELGKTIFHSCKTNELLWFGYNYGVTRINGGVSLFLLIIQSVVQRVNKKLQMERLIYENLTTVLRGVITEFHCFLLKILSVKI